MSRLWRSTTAVAGTATLGGIFMINPIAGLAVVGVVLLVVAAPILTATVVFGRHGARGTNPGPAGKLLVELVRVILGRPGKQ